MFDELIDVYCDRHESRYKVKTTGIKRWLLKNMDYSTKNYIKWNVGFTIVLRIDGRIAAFCSGYLNDKEYIVPRLSFSEKMKRYSPGMLLVNEVVKYIFMHKQIDVFDLSLGDEDYKIKMGGRKVIIKSGVLKSNVVKL